MYSKKINETNSSAWKTKYLKYKQKYIDLKNLESQLKQTGGMGRYTSYWNQHPKFTTDDQKININEAMKETMCLKTDHDPRNSQFLKLSEILSQLLNITNGTINLDFINNFYRYIYYDFKVDDTGNLDTRKASEFGIKLEGGKYDWIDPDNKKYKIISSHTQIHGRTTIHILIDTEELERITSAKHMLEPTKWNINSLTPLEKTQILSEVSYENKKVLKVFNTDIKPNEIKDYLSLQIIVNPDDDSSQSFSEYVDTNYVKLSKDTLNAYNFNMQTNFMRTNDSNILLATSNIDPINDYLVNIIMQQIELDNSQPVVQLNNDPILYQDVAADDEKENDPILNQDGDDDVFYDAHSSLPPPDVPAAAAASTTEPIAHQLRFIASLSNQPGILPAAREIPVARAAVMEHKRFTFIKYHNLFVTSIVEPYPLLGTLTPYWRYCILMDYMDGTINDYLSTTKFDSDDATRQTKILDILQQSEDSLKIFKNYKYLFTHSDFKVENLFYKRNPLRADGIDPGITIYLGDFDKSSISYHNIRFYPTGPLSTSNTLFDWLAQDNYTKKINPALNKLDFVENRQHIYKLSRAAHNLQSFIEFEELYMRYNFMPYYMSFDICSIIMSLFHTHYIDDITDMRLRTFLKRYIDTDEGINNMFNIFNIATTDFKGDFGKLISLLIDGQGGIARNTVRFINTFHTNDYVYINKLNLSSNNKICLSLPFAPNFYSAGVRETVAKPLDTNKIKDYGTLYNDNQVLLDEFYKNHENATVEYCYDWPSAASFYDIGRPTFIIKTNRYSKKSPFKYIWDYDNFPNENRDKQRILHYFQTTNNRDPDINKNIHITGAEKTALLSDIRGYYRDYQELFDPIMQAIYYRRVD